MASISESLFSKWPPTQSNFDFQVDKKIPGNAGQQNKKNRANKVLPSGRKTLNQNFLLSKKLVSSEKMLN